jgi:hypothetical protein
MYQLRRLWGIKLNVNSKVKVTEERKVMIYFKLLSTSVPGRTEYLLCMKAKSDFRWDFPYRTLKYIYPCQGVSQIHDMLNEERSSRANRNPDGKIFTCSSIVTLKNSERLNKHPSKNKIVFQIISIYYFYNSDLWSQYFSSSLAILA